jgi:hypothetical protein
MTRKDATKAKLLAILGVFHVLLPWFSNPRHPYNPNPRLPLPDLFIPSDSWFAFGPSALHRE